jgi:hypothetical protein
MAKAKTKKHKWRDENPDAKCPRHPKKDYRLLVEAAWDAGWRCEKRKKYIYCYPPDETQDWVWIPMTPSGSRTLKNVKSNLQAAGLDV